MAAMFKPLVGKQKITIAEARDLRVRFARRGALPSGDFVAQEAVRYGVTRESVRRILRHETHLEPPRELESLESLAPEPTSAEASDSAAALLRALTQDTSQDVLEMFKKGAADGKQEP